MSGNLTASLPRSAASSRRRACGWALVAFPAGRRDHQIGRDADPDEEDRDAHSPDDDPIPGQRPLLEEHHQAGREHPLLAAMVEHAMAPLASDLDPNLAWDKQIDAAMRDLHGTLMRHPG